MTGKEKYAKATEKIYQQILEMPRTKEGNFWHKMIYPHQVWLDGLYMAQPYYMEYEKRFNNRKNYKAPGNRRRESFQTCVKLTAY